MAWKRSREDTIELSIDALAVLVLEDDVAGDGWNWQNWMRDSEQYGTAGDADIGLALSEAWSWLMTRGLVVRDPSQSSPDAYKVSRLGRETLKYGVARLAAGERLGVALHPRLAQRIQQQFLLGEFELAATTVSEPARLGRRVSGGCGRIAVWVSRACRLGCGRGR